MSKSVGQNGAGRPPAADRELFDRVGQALSEIESFKTEWTAAPAQVARLRLGAVHARARLEKRIRSSVAGPA
jgi:hypothetical protein